MKPFFVYMLRCADQSYYVGHTDDLERRIGQHQAGDVEGYTRQRRPIELVWAQETATREEALAAELRIKGWARAKKEALIRGDWKAVQRHAWGTRNELPAHLRDEASIAKQPWPEITKAQPDSLMHRVDPSIPQGERGVASIPQPERRIAVREESGRVEPEVPNFESESSRTAFDAESCRTVSGAGSCRTVSDTGSCGTVTDTGSSRTVRPEVSKGVGALAQSPQEHSERGDSSLSQPVRALLHGIAEGNRRAIAKAITLLESTRPDHRAQADTLLNALLPRTGQALRLGISGVPGVGKSTFIEALGLDLIARGHRVAVLTIDPSSSISGGSILGDKTRMEKLSVNDAAYIRPSPASGTLGGVAEKTREAMLVCEAAGYDIVIVETVGVGQSETAVANMTDMFVLLQLPNAGDDLQAIKKGVMEIADLVVINKADIDPDAATRAEATITSALRVFSFHGHPGHWTPKVMQISALKGQGIDAFWQNVTQFQEQRKASGDFDARRKKQSLSWMWDLIHARLQNDFKHHPAVHDALPQTLRDVADARIAPSAAARALLDLFAKR